MNPALITQIFDSQDVAEPLLGLSISPLLYMLSRLAHQDVWAFIEDERPDSSRCWLYPGARNDVLQYL